MKVSVSVKEGNRHQKICKSKKSFVVSQIITKKESTAFTEKRYVCTKVIQDSKCKSNCVARQSGLQLVWDYTIKVPMCIILY